MNAANARERSRFSEAIAAEIRAERARVERTQQDVFEEAGIPRATYIRIENAKRVPDTTQLARICQALGIPMSELIVRAERGLAER